MAYRVEIKKSARKEFARLPAKVQGNVVDALALLSHNPHTGLLQIKKLKGVEALFRVRIGDYRLVYEVRNEQLLVIVIKIGHRSEVYRHR